MQTSHKLTRIFVALFTLVVLAISAMAGTDPDNIGVSDQKAGSVLVFPHYTSNSQTKADTRISITNVGAATTKVHVLLLDKTCAQADYFVCPTANGSVIDKASNLDPDNTGYIVAYAVDAMGAPVVANRLIGNAFVNDGEWIGNYGAEAFWVGRDAEVADVAPAKTDSAALGFIAPCEFAVEIQSPKDAIQKIITVGLAGDVNNMSVNGSAQVGVGFAYNAQERGGSFAKLLTGACYSEAFITDTNPRVPTTLGVVIGAGNAGHLKFSVGAAVGLILTSNKSKSGFSGIRTLHKTKITKSTLYVPQFMPTC